MKARIVIPAVLLCAACAGFALAVRAGTIWIDVPFVPQSKNGCGSASISMVMKYWEKQSSRPASERADAARIQMALYSSSEKGIPASAMRKYFEESGYRAFAFRGRWTDLAESLSLGRPLIASLKPDGRRGPYHYVVVVGFDSERG